MISPFRITPRIEQARINKALRDPPVPPLDMETCIRKALDDHPGKAVVSWSGGRCSTSVLYKALQIDPGVPVVFNDTGVEFPETYKFIDQIHDKWHLRVFYEIKPERSFWSIVQEYGFPMLRGKYRSSSKSKDGKPMCCQLLKEMPFQAFLKREGFEASITGLRACESRMRTFGIAQFGQYYYAKTLKHWRYHPIAFWSTEHLVAFNEEQNIPQNEVYSMGQERCGCWPCTGYLTWQKALRKSHPKLYRFLSKKTGQPTLWEYQGGDCIDFLRSEGLIS